MKRERYGVVSKAVMTDPTISITAKAIYAYFCSMSNDNGISFPHRDTILRDLNIEAKTYYRHLKLLTKKGYVVVLRDRGASRRNEYYITNRLNGGYGIIFQSFMRSPLSIKAKAIYAYLASFAGTGNEAHPRRSTILYHLNISEGTYYTHLAELQKYDIITIAKKRIDGKLRMTFIFSFSAKEYISTMHENPSKFKKEEYSTINAFYNLKNDHIKKDHATPRNTNRSFTNSHKRLNQEEKQSTMIVRAMIRAALASYPSFTPTDKLTHKRLNNLLEACNSIFTYPTTKLKGISYNRHDIIKRAELYLNCGALCVSDMIDIAEQSLDYEPINETAYMSALFMARLYPRA